MKQIGLHQESALATLWQALRTSSVVYLSLSAFAIVGGQLLQYVYGSGPYLKGQSMGIVFTLFAFGLSGAAWLTVREWRPARGLMLWIGLAMIALWVIATLRAVAESSSFNYTALATPFVLAMILAKPPGVRSAWRFADIVAVGLAATIILTQVLDLTGLRPFRTDILARWEIPIPGLDLPARWEGMFGDPNNAGFVAAFLIVYGFHRRGPLRISLATVGGLILLLSQSRTALIALAVGSVVSVLTSTWLARRQASRVVVVGAGSGLVATGVLAVLLIDPTFNGRVPIWQASLKLLVDNPLFGVGSRGIDAASRATQIPWGNIDAHSVVIDSLTRSGIIAGILAATVIVSSLVLTYSARMNDRGTSLAVCATFTVGALTYTVTSWQYLNTQVIPLIAALLLAHANVSTSTDPNGQPDA